MYKNQSSFKFSNPSIRLSWTVPDELSQKLREEGIFVDPEGTKNLPQYVRQKDIKDVNLVPGDEPANLQEIVQDVSLIKIYKPTEKDLKDIDGGESFASGTFIVIGYTPPKQYQRVPGAISNYVDENKKHYGEIKAINVEDGNLYYFGPINFAENSPEEVGRKKRDLASVFHQVETQAKQRSLETMAKANEASRAWNKRLERALRHPGNLTNLPLQLRDVKAQVQDRMTELDNIIAASENILQGVKPSSISAMEEHIEEQIRSAMLAEKDFKEYVLNKYYYDWDKLVEDLRSNRITIPSSIPNPEQFKQRLLMLGEIAYQRYLDNKDSKIQRKQEVVQEFDIEQYDTSQPLEELTPEDVRHQVITTGYTSYDGLIKEWSRKKQGSIENKNQLAQVVEGIDAIHSYINSLPSGTRGESYLRTPEGYNTIQEILDICQEKCKGFIERYKTTIIDKDGKIDFKKFGVAGSPGNGLVVVALHRLWTIISKMAKNIKDNITTDQDYPAAEADVVTPPPSISGQDVDGTDVIASNLVTTPHKKVKHIKISRNQWQNIK